MNSDTVPAGPGQRGRGQAALAATERGRFPGRRGALRGLRPRGERLLSLRFCNPVGNADTHPRPRSLSKGQSGRLFGSCRRTRPVPLRGSIRNPRGTTRGPARAVPALSTARGPRVRAGAAETKAKGTGPVPRAAGPAAPGSH